jgi:hypothetical protein
MYCVHKGAGSDNRVVSYRELIPDETYMCPMAVSHPYHVFKVSEPVGRVNFKGQEAVYSCE